MFPTAFTFFVFHTNTQLIDKVVEEAIRLTPDASHLRPVWYYVTEDKLTAHCDATPNEVRALLDDLAIFCHGDRKICNIMADIAGTYISDVASHTAGN